MKWHSLLFHSAVSGGAVCVVGLRLCCGGAVVVWYCNLAQFILNVCLICCISEKVRSILSSVQSQS